MIVLDTNVVSELMKPVPDAAMGAWLSTLGETPLATTTITIAEIIYGLERLPDGRRRIDLETRFEQFVSADAGLAVLSLDESAAREAGRLRALRESAGLGASASDMMIAGIAAAIGASVATRNISDFDALPVSTIDPWNAQGGT